MKLRKLFALLMAAVMLLGMVPAGHAEVVDCNHNWAWRWPNGEPANCKDWKWSESYCTKCGIGDGGFEQCGPCQPGSWHWDGNPPANCNEWGIQNQTCSVCGEAFNEREVRGDHKWSGYTTVEPAGCETPGEEATSCTVCGEKGSSREIPAKGHDWGNWKWEVEATCDKEGLRVRYCKRCNMREEDYAQGGEHKFGKWITTVEPTCTERGRQHHICSVCGYSEWDAIPTVDHIWGEWRVIEEPQVGIPGTERRSCTFGCGTHEDREIPPLEEENAAGLSLNLVLSSTPANGTHFVVGEEVTFTETWSNGTDKTLYPFSVSIWTCGAPVFGSAVDQICSWFAEDSGGPVAPGATGSHSLTVTVTEADVARGAIYAMAELLSTVQDGPDLDNITTPFVTAPCGSDNSGDYDLSVALSVTKQVTSTPANGIFYLPGEIIFFEITATNTSAETLTNLTFHDPLISDAPGATVPTFAPGEAATFQAFYPVTNADAFAGSVNNIAYVTAADAKGHQVVEYSNTVTVSCGHHFLNVTITPDDPYGIFHSLSIVKKEESLPMNGQYYTEGEVIHYSITYANDGELPLTDVQIWDVLNVTTPVASAEMLNPGENRVCYYQHTVSAEDVAAGSVTNIAHASYPVPNYAGFANSTSNVVISKTSADETRDLPPFGIIDTDALHGGDSYCICTITGRDNVSATYETTFCTVHADTQSSALILLQAAATPEAQMQAASYAAALWRTEAETLYQEIFEAADSAAKTVVMTEYVRFLTDVANYEAMLKVLYPDQPALAAMKVAEIWENKCVDMCYDAHATAAERKDSLLAVTPTAGASAAECNCVTVSETNGQKTDVQSYCPAHSFPFNMVDALLQGHDTAEAWTRIREIWIVELTSAYNKLSSKLGANNVLAMIEYKALTQWLAAREAALVALYPGNPEVVAQIMVKTIMDRVNDLCQIAK